MTNTDSSKTMVEVYATRILPEEEFLRIREELLTFLPAGSRRKITSFFRVTDAQRSLFGELLVRRMLCDKLSLPNTQLQIEYGEKGKPFVDGSPVHFNMSHSGDWVVAVLSDQPAGIDIERIKPNRLSIARRFFTETEFKSILDTTEESRVEHFFTLWTLKESYLKAVGRGLTLSLSSFSIKHEKGEYLLDNNGNFANVNFKIMPLDEGYKLAICAFVPIRTEKVIILPARGYLDVLRSI